MTVVVLSIWGCGMNLGTFARFLLGALLSVVLTVTVISPVQADEPEVQVTPATEAPLLESEPLVLPAPTTPEGDFSELQAPAPTVIGKSAGGQRPPAPFTPVPTESDFDPDSSEVVGRTEFTTTFENPDGSKTTQVGMGPLNAKDESGSWVPVDAFLDRNSDGSWSTDAHPLDPSFAADASDKDAFTVSRGGYEIGYTLVGADSSQISRVPHVRQAVAGDDFVYRDVFDGVDLTFQVRDAGVKEALVLDSVPTAADSHWSWHIDVNALTPSVDEDGVVNFTDRYGKVQFHIPAPVMWDSSGVPGQSEPAMKNLKTTVVQDGDGWLLTLSADHRWLADEDRVYPVTVDPTTGVGPSTINAYKSDGAGRTDAVHVGNARSGGDAYWRTNVLYNYAAWAGTQVYSAALVIGYDGYGYEGTAGGNVYAATCMSFSCAGEWLTSYSVANGETSAGGYNTPLSNRVAQWVRDS
jgi:hypothetical protein